MSARDRNRRRLLSPEERVLWSTITRSIAPLREAPLTMQDEGAAETVVPPAPTKRAVSPVRRRAAAIAASHRRH